ncbi:hypothetical protein BDZ94DRAFT_1239946 [Collybia nuda]|uniref:Uncharacterized protein n=1 Tax=Collybia nuda TaxID=64659 RepID=A0A9P5XXI1_9AGAR|nr:hypothetical protein BDZ94DRAFT_1239946 [Collybia nuda]
MAVQNEKYSSQIQTTVNENGGIKQGSIFPNNSFGSSDNGLSPNDDLNSIIEKIQLNVLPKSSVGTQTGTKPTQTSTSTTTESARKTGSYGLSTNKGAIGGIAGTATVICILLVCLTAWIVKRRRVRQIQRQGTAGNDENIYSEETHIRGSEDGHAVHCTAAYPGSQVAEIDLQSTYSETSSSEVLDQPAMSLGDSENYPLSFYSVSTLPVYAESVLSVPPPAYSDFSTRNLQGTSGFQNQGWKWG